MDILAKRWKRMIMDSVFDAAKILLCGCDEHRDTFLQVYKVRGT